MEETEAIAKLTALAQHSRLAVFRLLARCEPAEISAGDIAEQLKVQPNTLSFHLKELQSSGLIQSRREGRSILYRLHITGMQSLLGFLTHDCCQGRPELCLPSTECC